MSDFQKELSAEEVTALLRHFEWRPTGRMPGVYEIWSEPGEREDEILVPLDSEKSDYRALMNRALDALMRHYGSTARELVTTLRMQATALLYATRWKKDSPVEAGMIGWEQGEELYSAARAQLIAAAKSTRQPRRYHGQASSHIGRSFLESTLMGQTDIGSFIITAYTPSERQFFTSASETGHAEIPKGLWHPQGAISGAQILNTFETALRTTRSILDEYRGAPRAESFLEGVSDGLSYEFTKALSQIVTGGNATIEIVRHDPIRLSRPRTVVEFQSVEAPVLQAAANMFTQDEESRRVTLVGEVTLLSRTHAEDARVIRLEVHGGADINKARVRLNAEQYEQAMDAHRSEAALKVSGRLEREGRYYWLYDASGLEIVAPPAHRASGPMRTVQGVTLFDEVFDELDDEGDE